MKIKTQKNRNRKIILAALIAAGLVVAYAAVAYGTDSWPFSSTDESSEQTSTTDDDNQSATPPDSVVAPTNTDEEADAPTEDTGQSQKTPEENAPADTPDNAQDGPAVTITSIQDIGEQTRISTLIDAISNEGKCVLNFTNNSGGKITQTVGVQASASASTCKGFKIDNSKLSNGTWTATITVTIGGESTVAAKEYEVS